MRKKQFFWFMKAAEQGDLPAQFQLGYMLAEELGTERNKEETPYWWS